MGDRMSIKFGGNRGPGGIGRKYIEAAEAEHVEKAPKLALPATVSQVLPHMRTWLDYANQNIMMSSLVRAVEAEVGTYGLVLEDTVRKLGYVTAAAGRDSNFINRTIAHDVGSSRIDWTNFQGADPMIPEGLRRKFPGLRLGAAFLIGEAGKEKAEVVLAIATYERTGNVRTTIKAFKVADLVQAPSPYADTGKGKTNGTGHSTVSENFASV